ncbi:MAG: hypothetical protein A3I79_08185 [Gemmatimonadetes bacterium RIFCSPLOWO2_02_FULL_71_11]|nr:MAG: hypothetical protein A3I79_08185 [Gemmatimonadetes bacterium RIFCSPLOWO2_02_FULL_71_11]
MPINADVTTTLDGALDNAFYEVRPLGAEFQSGAELELNLQRYLDVPGDSFEIFPGTIVAPGRYEWSRVEVQLESSPARSFQVELGASAGDYYTGRATELAYGVAARVAPHLIAEVEGELQWVRLPTGRFDARTARLRLDYATSPRLNTTVFLQYDNESERLAVNARLHWIPRPGSDVYLVWNSAWPTDLAGGVPWRRPLRGALVGKVVWYVRP